MKIFLFPTAAAAAVAIAAFVLAAPLPGGNLHAQDESENNATSGTTYDSTGIVTAVGNGATITVQSRRGLFTYALDQDLHVIGADVRPRKISQVHIGDEVTVYYYKHVGTETAARIVVLKEAGVHAK